MDRFQHLVTTTAELREIVGVPSELSLKKERHELDSHMTRFIAASPFVLLGTVGRDGTCDVSPRGDAIGVARVLDPRTLAIPDWSGNRRTDSLRNIIETGRAGLLFLIPGLGETLRVNGRACITQDEVLLAELAVNGKQPKLAIGFAVEECFLQCAKALIRSQLWHRTAEGPAAAMPCFAEILMDQTKLEGQTVEALQKSIDESYANRLY